MTSSDHNKMFLQVFVSTGELQAMFTLRTIRIVNGFAIESYIKNLSTDYDKAVALAQAYTDNLSSRISGDTCSVVFVGTEIDEVFKRRGKLSVRETLYIEDIEAGIVPFGKHRGTKIQELPDSYVLWLTDLLKDGTQGPVMFSLASIASGIADERGLIAKRDEKRAAQLREDLKSEWFGEIGKRYEEDVEIVYKKLVENDYEGPSYFRYTIKIGDCILTHKGGTDLPLGKCRIKFTVKFQFEAGDDKIKKTYVNRPSLIKG